MKRNDSGLGPIHRLLASAIVAVAMLAAAVCLGQSDGPVAKITAGEAILLQATGSNGALAWRAEPPEALRHCELVEIGRTKSPDGTVTSSEALLFRAWEWPDRPTIVFLLIASDGVDIVTDRFVVPADDPNPPVPPVPGARRVVTVMESLNPDPDHVLLLAQLTNRLEDQGHDWERADPDLKENRKTPAWLQVVLDEIEARGFSLPVVAVVNKSSAGDFRVVAIEELAAGLKLDEVPGELAGVIAFLKQHGVE